MDLLWNIYSSGSRLSARPLTALDEQTLVLGARRVTHLEDNILQTRCLRCVVVSSSARIKARFLHH